MLSAILMTAALLGPAPDGLELHPLDGVTAEYSVAVWSAEDRKGRAFLVARRAGAEPRVLGAAAGRGPFDADLGTDANGRLQVVFARCPARGDCDVRRIGLGRHDVERPVPVAAKPVISEGTPSQWEGQLAWSAAGEVFVARAGHVVARPVLDAQASFVGHVELASDHLASVAVIEAQEGGGAELLRHTDLVSGRTRVVATGRTFTGVSFAAQRLGWRTGRDVWRYDLRARTYERAVLGAPRGITGLRILRGDRVLVVRGTRVRVERLRFVAAAAP